MDNELGEVIAGKISDELGVNGLRIAEGSTTAIGYDGEVPAIAERVVVGIGGGAGV